MGIVTKRRFGMGVAGVLAVLTFWSPGSADAVFSYQGSDYSFDWYGSQQYTCDEESDSTPVKANYQLTDGTYYDVRDSDGNNGNCAGGPWTYAYIHRHKTCEYRSWWPDTCGNWAYTGN